MFLYQRYRKTSILFIVVILLSVVSIFVRHDDQEPSDYAGRVVDIKENYSIVKTNKSKVLVYTQDSISYDDYIEFDGVYERVFTPKSKSAFNFERYLKNKNIYYSIKPKNITIKKESHTFRSTLYKRINKHEDHLLLKKVIFQINSNDLDSDLVLMLLSSGVVIRILINHIIRILKRYVYENEVVIIKLSLYGFMMIIFKNYSFFLSLIMYEILSKLNLEHIDHISLTAILILIIDPFYMFSLSFIISNLFRFVMLINKYENPILCSIVIFIPVQLINFYRCNPISIVLYPYYKIVGCFAYVFSYIDILLNTSISHNILKVFTLNFSQFDITGHMNIVVLCLWIFFSLLLLSRRSFVYKIIIVLIVLLNQNQLLFNPMFSYTQLYVGQGDASILKHPFKRDVVMIDTGSKFNLSKVLAHLDYYGIKTISHVIVSHDDEDHSGNLDVLCDQYRVLNVVMEPQDVMFHNLRIHNVNYDLESDNDSSLITYFQINDYIYLLLGDVSKHVERMFIHDYPEVSANIVKIGHHGSDTSSGNDLLELENIKLLLNSSGHNNMYKHPHHNVLKRINQYGLLLLDTQKLGDIEVKHFLNFNFLDY